MSRYRLQRSHFIFILFLSLFLFSACASQNQTKKVDYGKNDSLPSDLRTTAENMLRLDDYKHFEGAEFRFISLVMANRKNIKLAGWLAQLYIAWAEQLRSEVDFLRIKLAASETADRIEDKKAFYALIDYRLQQLTEVEDNARKKCNLLVELHPKDYIAHRVVADYYRVMGDKEKAALHIKHVENLNPQSAGLAFLKGAYAMQFENNSKDAIHHFDDAIEKDPMFVKALYFKGLAVDKLAQTFRAKDIMKQVLTLSPTHPGARAYLSAEEYITSLTKEAKQRLKYAQADLSAVKDTPKLVYWVGEWEQSGARLRYRIASPKEKEVKIKLIATLANNQDSVFDSKEKELSIAPDSYESGSVHLKAPDAIESEQNYGFFIQLMAKENEEAKWRTLDVKRAALPLDKSEKPEHLEGQASKPKPLQ